MTVTAYIRELMEKGLTVEQALLAAEVYESNPPKSKGAVRQQRYRDNRNEASRVTHSVTTPSPLIPPDKEIPPTPPKEINPPISPQPQRASTASEFAEWYSIYPNKVGKAAAERAFASARKRSSFEEILTGLRRYVSKRDDRPWCNPATWLNQDRWHDQPATNGHPPPQQIDWAKRMEVYERSGTWAPGWGPKPGEIGCKAPKNGVLNYVNG